MSRELSLCAHCQLRLNPLTSSQIQLTPSEKRICLLLLDLVEDQQIARLLRYRSVRSLRAAIWRIIRKAGVRNRAELMARFAVSGGAGLSTQ